MGGKIQDPVVLPKRVLSPVAVMEVPIDNQDFFQPVMSTGILGGQGHIIEQAKAHGPIGFSMMARRPDEGKAIIDGLPGQQGIDQVEKTSGGHQGRFIGFSGSLSIRVQRDKGLSRRGGYLFYMVRSMNIGQFLQGGRAGLNGLSTGRKSDLPASDKELPTAEDFPHGEPHGYVPDK